jgi:AcrR family transcriptional regulator
VPPKCKFTREQIVFSALTLARRGGLKAVTARAVGEALHASSKVIFSLFENMEQLHAAVLQAAEGVYQSFLREDMAAGRYPPYKASGMAYIRFAREERELFRLLFMRDRSLEAPPQDDREVEELIRLIQKGTGLDGSQARRFHLEMWIYVHGIATMVATGYLDWDQDQADILLSDAYHGILGHYLSKGGS